MTSYSKRMMQIAAEWMAVNPDPKSAFVRIPGMGSGYPMPDRDADIDRYNRAMRGDPELTAKIGAAVAEITRLNEEIAIIRDGLASAEGQYLELINRPPPIGHAHHVHDVRVLGRWILSWARHGYNVFDLSSDFTAAMLLTDPRELDIASVRLPFEGVLILLPDGFARGVDRTFTKIHVWEVAGGDPMLERFRSAVTESTMAIANVQGVLSSAAASRGMRFDGSAGSIAMATLRSLADPPTPIAKAVQEAPSPTEGRSFCIHATDGVRAISTSIRQSTLSWEALEALPEGDIEDADREARRTLSQIVLGTFAYIGAVERGMESAEPAKRDKRRPKDEGPKIKHWDVGRTIRIAPALVRAARAGSREVALRLKHRHIVRGHYRDQPHGIGRALRKKIWICPFWKGPDDGATLVHTYKIQEGKTE